jgi:hypothetical protein
MRQHITEDKIILCSKILSKSLYAAYGKAKAFQP